MTTIGVAVQRSAARVRIEDVAPAVLSLALVGVTAHATGGFSATTWPLTMLGPLVVAGAVLGLVDRFELGRIDGAFLGAFGAVVLWTVLSGVWSDSVPRTIADTQRDLVYVSAVAALLLLTTRGRVGSLLAGVAVASTGVCAYALATRLFPDRLGLHVDYNDQLATPLGYCNGVGFVAMAGIVLALGLVASHRGTPVRVAASAALVLLVATLYFTFSRGSWLALALALAVSLAVDPRRGRLVVATAAFGPLVAITVILCGRFPELHTMTPTLVGATHDGHRLTVLLVPVALLACSLPFVVDRTAERVAVSRRTWLRLGASLAALALVAAVVGIARAGGPGEIWDRASSGFRTTQWSPDTNLNNRLFTLSGHNRIDYWHAAWSEVAANPWLGSGAGTYGIYWTRERPLGVGVLDAHSLYLETLAELGPLGLALLCGLLIVPLLALRRAPARPWVPVAAGVYVAFLADAGVDWFWELPTVTLLALCCGVALIASAREAESGSRVRRSTRTAALATVGVLAAVAITIQIANRALGASRIDTAAGRYDEATAAARQAIRLAPWSAAGWESLAQIEKALGNLSAARLNYHRAIAKDPTDWHLWYELAGVSTGKARADAAARVRYLNPLAPDIGV